MAGCGTLIRRFFSCASGVRCLTGAVPSPARTHGWSLCKEHCLT